jgi:hypothetical protein
LPPLPEASGKVISRAARRAPHRLQRAAPSEPQPLSAWQLRPAAPSRPRRTAVMAFATRLPCVLAAPRACGPGERRSVSATAASPAASAPLPARRAACLRGSAVASTACAQRARASGCRGRRAASGACFVRAAAVADAAAPPALPTPRLAALAAEFAALPEGPERYKLLLQYAAALPALPPAARSLENRVMGCTSQTWLTADLGPDGAVRIAGAATRPLAPPRACGGEASTLGARVRP